MPKENEKTFIGSISCRTQKSKVESLNPHPYEYQVAQMDEEGNVQFTKSNPVAPSMASDFSVTNNAIYRGLAHGIQTRVRLDPVDVDNFLNKMM